MRHYVVRGPNWRTDITLNEEFDNDSYAYVEAATRAIEKIYNTTHAEVTITRGDIDKPLFNSYIQVSKHEHDIPIPIPEDEYTEELNELANIRVANGQIQFLFSPLILANAGRFKQAEYLKHIIEND